MSPGEPTSFLTEFQDKIILLNESRLIIKVKVSPITGHAHARVHVYTARALGRGRVDSPTLGRLYPRESSRYSFCRG